MAARKLFFDDFAGFAFEGAVEDGEREVLGIEDFGEEALDAVAGGLVDAAAHAPEVADAADVLLAGHDALEAVSEEGFGVDAAGGEGAFEDRQGDEFGGAGGDGGFDEDQAVGGDELADASKLFSRAAMSARPVRRLPRSSLR